MENPMNKNSYILEYTYYKYNDGQSNNGTYRSTIELKSIQEAYQLFEKIHHYLKNKLPEKEKEELETRLIPSSGYLKEGVRIYEKKWIADSIDNLKILVNKENLEQELIVKDEVHQTKI